MTKHRCFRGHKQAGISDFPERVTRLFSGSHVTAFPGWRLHLHCQRVAKPADDFVAPGVSYPEISEMQARTTRRA
jgi:hypothetical protein